MLAYDVNRVPTFNNGEYHYRCYFVNMTKEQAKKALENVNFDLTDKKI